MYESVLTELLWFAAGYLLTLLSLVWLALCYREPEIIKKGAIACPVALVYS